MYKLIKDFFNQFKRCSKGHAVFHINGVSVQATTNGDKLNNLKIILITGKPIYSKYKTELEIDNEVDFPITEYIKKELIANPSKYFVTFVD